MKSKQEILQDLTETYIAKKDAVNEEDYAHALKCEGWIEALSWVLELPIDE